MKQCITLCLLSLFLLACKQEVKPSVNIESVSPNTITTSIYPEAVTKIFDAHGGIDVWNRMKQLRFTIPKPNGNEITITNLQSRFERIEAPDFTLGYNGDFWVKSEKNIPYRGNAKFYKGLMLYFYAMPFIVGDAGIIYETAEPLTFNGKTYPGVLISYQSDIGTSPDDQYIIYYNSETGQMEWLAYTVTFGKNKKSKTFKFIKYNNWQTVNGLLLPKSIDWYNFENNQPTTKRNTVTFTNVVLTEEAPKPSVFNTPTDANIIK